MSRHRKQRRGRHRLRRTRLSWPTILALFGVPLLVVATLPAPAAKPHVPAPWLAVELPAVVAGPNVPPPPVVAVRAVSVITATQPVYTVSLRNPVPVHPVTSPPVRTVIAPPPIPKVVVASGPPRNDRHVPSVQPRGTRTDTDVPAPTNAGPTPTGTPGDTTTRSTDGRTLGSNDPASGSGVTPSGTPSPTTPTPTPVATPTSGAAVP